MAKKTSPDFEFTFKAHKSMTHKIRDKETGNLIGNKDFLTVSYMPLNL